MKTLKGIKRISLAFVLMMVTMSPLTIIGQANNVVMLTYEEALALALRDLLPVIDADALIGRVQDQRDDLEYDLEQLEQGNWLNESIDAIRDELWRIDAQLWNAEHAQGQIPRQKHEKIPKS